MELFQMLSAISQIADEGACQRQRLLSLAGDLLEASNDIALSSRERRNLRIAALTAERAAHNLPTIKQEVAGAVRQITRA